jgi:hypothetical protein
MISDRFVPSNRKSSGSPLSSEPEELSSDKELLPYLDVLTENTDTTQAISYDDHFDWGKFVANYPLPNLTETAVLTTPAAASNPFAPPATHNSSSASAPSTERSSKKRAADQRRTSDIKRAKRELGPDATVADLKRHYKAELAKKLWGSDATANDYGHNQRTELAKKILGEKAEDKDYQAYRKAIRQGKLPENATAEQYWEYDKTRKKHPRKKTNPPIPSPPPKSDSELLLDESLLC